MSDDYDYLFASEVVDVGTPGIDRGEDDYVPTDEYYPGDEDAPAVNAAPLDPDSPWAMTGPLVDDNSPPPF